MAEIKKQGKRKREGKREREGEKSPVCWFTLQMTPTARAGGPEAAARSFSEVSHHHLHRDASPNRAALIPSLELIVCVSHHSLSKGKISLVSFVIP